MQNNTLISRCQSKKLILFLGTLGCCCLSALPAWALPQGCYQLQGKGEDSFYGSVTIASINGDTARTHFPDTDFFSITTFDGVEPIRLYAGILHKNKANYAEGTLLYSMSNSERTAAGWNKEFATGSWHQDVNCTKSDIRFTFKDGKLSYSYADPKLLPPRNGYSYFGSKIPGMANELALKICVLEKLLRHWCWSSEAPVGNKYSFSYNDSFQFHNILLSKPKTAVQEFSLDDQLTDLSYIYDEGNRTINMLWIPKQQ